MEENEINNNIKFISSQNSAMNFEIIVQSLEKIAQGKGVQTTEVIDDFIMDLQNFYNKDYEKKVESIVLRGEIIPLLINSMISYVTKSRKTYEKKEKNERREELKKINETTWKMIEREIDEAILDKGKDKEMDIIKEFISSINEENSGYELDNKEKKYMTTKLKVLLEDKINAKKAMEQIEEIVERELAVGNIKSRAKYLESIRIAICGNKKNNPLNNIKISKKAKEYLINMIEERIGEEKDQIYYEQVKNFTNGFQFLKEYPEVIKAACGFPIKKFTDKESYERFYSLRLSLRDGGFNEYKQISRLLEGNTISGADRRILTERKNIMDKEINAKYQKEAPRELR